MWREIPDTIPMVNYFLDGINSPAGYWIIRVILCCCFLGVLVSYHYYKKKE